MKDKERITIQFACTAKEKKMAEYIKKHGHVSVSHFCREAIRNEYKALRGK